MVRNSIQRAFLSYDVCYEKNNYKGEWWKEIGRKDIEAIKIIEKPLGIFKDQGLKIKILEGKDIDDFLSSVKD